jgi:hypothetical protein
MQYFYIFDNKSYLVYGEEKLLAIKNALIEAFFRIYSKVSKIEEGKNYYATERKKGRELYKMVRTRIYKDEEDQKFVNILLKIYYSVDSFSIETFINKPLNYLQNCPTSLCDNTFWRLKYIKTYYNIIPNITYWKEAYEEESRNNKNKIIDFDVLSSSQKIELLKSLQFSDWENITSLLTNRENYRILYTNLIKSLLIYNNKEKLKSIPNLFEVTNYYNLNLLKEFEKEEDVEKIAEIIQGFYKNKNDSNAFPKMYQEAIHTFANNLLDELKLEKTDIPDFKNSSKFISEVENTSLKKGIIFCHGHIHNAPEIPEQLKNEPIVWTLVDIDQSSNPDIIGSYKSWDTYLTLGLESYDYIISHFCPIFYNIDAFATFLRDIRWLLKLNGKLYIKNIRNAGHRNNPDVSKIIVERLAKKLNYTIDKNNFFIRN